MSINLDNVKAIVHNNKNVVKIEDSHGIIWQKPASEEWHTIWEGTLTVSTPSPSTTSWVYDYTTIVNPNLTGEHSVRFYFSNLDVRVWSPAASGHSSADYYYNDGKAYDAKPTSPVELTMDFDSTYNPEGTTYAGSLVGGYGYYSYWTGSSSLGQYRTIRVVYFPATGFKFKTGRKRYSDGSAGGFGACTMTLTKIEVLY